jgi:hypothetical protein
MGGKREESTIETSQYKTRPHRHFPTPSPFLYGTQNICLTGSCEARGEPVFGRIKHLPTKHMMLVKGNS